MCSNQLSYVAIFYFNLNNRCRTVRRFDGAHYADISEPRQLFFNKKNVFLFFCLIANQVVFILCKHNQKQRGIEFYMAEKDKLALI